MLLRNKDKEALLAIFATATMPMEVWAYGSRVTGEANEGSDLHLVIRTHYLQKLPMDVMLDLRGKIQRSNIPIATPIPNSDQALTQDALGRLLGFPEVLTTDKEVKTHHERI